MDVVLEIFDTFIFDRLYAVLLPTSSITFTRNTVKDAATSTFSSMREMPTALSHASRFLQLEPSHFAYMSAWSRDNIWRQLLSLYLITWYVMRRPHRRKVLTEHFPGSSAAWCISSLPPYRISSSSITRLSRIRSTSRTRCALR